MIFNKSNILSRFKLYIINKQNIQINTSADNFSPFDKLKCNFNHYIINQKYELQLSFLLKSLHPLLKMKVYSIPLVFQDQNYFS